jgi:hypothetical protein
MAGFASRGDLPPMDIPIGRFAVEQAYRELVEGGS